MTGGEAAHHVLEAGLLVSVDEHVGRPAYGLGQAGIGYLARLVVLVAV